MSRIMAMPTPPTLAFTPEGEAEEIAEVHADQRAGREKGDTEHDHRRCPGWTQAIRRAAANESTHASWSVSFPNRPSSRSD